MARILEARIKQKKDTLANWMDNDLILLDGEQAFVTNANGREVNYKIGDGTKTFAELEYMIQYDQSAFVPVSGSVLPASDGNVHYSLVGSGTYTRAGQPNVVVPDGGMGIIVDDGDSWSLGNVVELPSNTPKIPLWSAGTYSSGELRYWNGLTWQVQFTESGGIITTTQEPSVQSTEWVSTSYMYITSNDEYLYAIVDSNGVLLWGKRYDGTTWDSDYSGRFEDIVASIDSINTSLVNVSGFSFVSNPEFLFAITDGDNKVVWGIRVDGRVLTVDDSMDFTKEFEELKYFLENTLFTDIDSDNRLQVVVDLDGKVVSERSSNGVLFEKVGISTPNVNVDKKLVFSPEALSELERDLKEAGFSAGGKGDQSGNDLVTLPVPKNLAFMNVSIGASELPVTKTADVKGEFEYWDLQGNYFKKPMIINAQGNSSLIYPRKNFTIDTDDGSDIQFGNWFAHDSYYIKSHYTDALRSTPTLAYRYMKDILNSRPLNKRYPFYEISNSAPNYLTGVGDMDRDLTTGAEYIADGFPVAFYTKGEFYGIFNVTLKKHRKNFDMNRNNVSHVWLDGTLSGATFWDGEISWSDFEVRNPNPNKWGFLDINGDKYDRDFPKELSNNGNTGLVKEKIQRLATFNSLFNAASGDTAKRAVYEQFFFPDNIIDYWIFSNIIYNSDGFAKNWQWYTKDGLKWAVSVHDCDIILGKFWKSNVIVEESSTRILGNSPISYNILNTLYRTSLVARYKELRDNKIIDSDYFISKVKDFINIITSPMLSRDLDIWRDTPSYRSPKIDQNWRFITVNNISGATAWSPSVAYPVGQRVYVNSNLDNYVFEATMANTGNRPMTGVYSSTPTELGYYESVDRIYKFIQLRIQLLDELLSY